MSSDEDQIDIKPQSPLPATSEDIINNVPHRLIDIELGADLVGLRTPHYKSVVRETFNKQETTTTTLHTVAQVYAHLRSSPVLLCDTHFTTDTGLDNLQNFITYLESRSDYSAPRETFDATGWETEIEGNEVYHGSAYEHMTEIPPQSIQAVVTSPPYWAMREYKDNCHIAWTDGTTCPYGLESTPEAYIRHTIELCWRLRPLLTDTGTIWWHVSDGYNTRTQLRQDSAERMNAVKNGESIKWSDRTAKRHSAGHAYLKDKDRLLIPHRIAQGLERSGFWVRAAVTWEKQNVVPEPVADRPNVGHETILLISKAKNYKFDESRWRDLNTYGQRSPGEPENLRTVWKFTTAHGDKGHGAPTPVDLPARCITLGTELGDTVYDPFLGSGTTAVAAQHLNRRWIGAEYVQEYIDIAHKRLHSDLPGNSRHSQQTLSAYTDAEDPSTDTPKHTSQITASIQKPAHHQFTIDDF